MNQARRRVMLWGGLAAAIALVAIAGQWALTAFAPSIQVAGSRVDPATGGLALDGIVIGLPGGMTIRVGTAEFAGLSLVTSAQAAENITLKDVSLDAAGIVYRAPTISIVGSSIGQAEFKSFVDKTSRQPFAGRLAAFSATSITIPEATVERTAERGKETYEFRNVAFGRVTQGKAATVAMAGGGIKSTSQGITFAAVNVRTLDLVFLAGLLSDSASEREPRLLYAAASADRVQLHTALGVTEIAQLTSSDARFQPGAGQPRFLPALGQLKAANVKVETRAPRDTTKWQLKEFAIVADSPRNGIPTKYRFAIDGLAMDLNASATASPGKDLIELGYDSVLLSVIGDAEWNPQSGDFTIKQASVDGGNIGSIVLRATLGKVTRETLLDVNKRLKETSTIKTMSLVIENKGLYERVVMREAKKRGKSLDDTRRELSLAAATSVRMMLAGFDDQAIPAALIKFATKPGKLSVTARSKSPAGVPMSDFNTRVGGQPAIAGKLDVVASAE